MHTFILLYLVFCYLLCVNWVNNVEFHDLGACSKTLRLLHEREINLLISKLVCILVSWRSEEHTSELQSLV